jgi:hypothetical protein
MNHIYQQPQFGEDWFTYPELYSQIVNKFSSGSKFVEVGSWKGKSSSYMCVEIANSQKDIEFFCVDHFIGSIEHKNDPNIFNLYETFKSNMLPVESYYTLLKMSSICAANTFDDKSLDFVFIDASHEYEDVKNDIFHWYPKVKDGGILAGHDYHHDPVKQAVLESGLKNIKVEYDCWIYENI